MEVDVDTSGPSNYAAVLGHTLIGIRTVNSREKRHKIEFHSCWVRVLKMHVKEFEFETRLYATLKDHIVEEPMS